MQRLLTTWHVQHGTMTLEVCWTEVEEFGTDTAVDVVPTAELDDASKQTQHRYGMV